MTQPFVGAVMFGAAAYWVFKEGLTWLSYVIADNRYWKGKHDLLTSITEEGYDSPRVKLLQKWRLNIDELAPMFGVFVGIIYFAWD